jgi:hypothetical protein
MDGDGVSTVQDVNGFRQDLWSATDDELKALRDDLKRKDYGYSQHGGRPGPDSAWLWDRILATKEELALRWKMRGASAIR